jgi:hypothetical protein
MWLFSLLPFLISVSQAKEMDVTCGASKIDIKLDKSYLEGQNIHVKQIDQLTMSKNSTNCIPTYDRDTGAYRFIIFAPFNSCNTRVTHETEDYHYENEIYFKSAAGVEPSLIFKWKCMYEDQYVVSADFAIKPVERTLQFVTEKGKFDVAMKVYQDEQFTPQSEVTERTPIKLNTPVYVSLDLDRPFKWNNIVLSLRSCFATDSPNSSTATDNYHSLIANMCADPNDETIRILENGQGNNARFKFNMFKWRSKTSYIYMHCEVHLCDKDKEQCSNDEDICTGADRTRRSPSDVSEPEPGTVLTELKPTFMSKGPIIMDEVTIVGKGTIEALQIIEYDNDFLRVYIITTVCVVLVFVGILVGIIAVVIRRRNQQSKELFGSKLTQNTVLIRSIYQIISD